MSACMASCAAVPCERSGAANRLSTTTPRVTRAASRSARTGSPANWNALTPITASNASSSNGSDSMSPSHRSPSGRRSRATPSSPGLMSRPLTMAPRRCASSSARPDPQPTSSSRVPRPTPAASSTASNSGRLWASASSAHACGSVPHSRRCTSAVLHTVIRTAYTIDMGRTLLGLGCGQPDGSAEILLKAALQSAEAAGADVSLVRLHDLDVEGDDAWWFWERLVECDALIVSTPIISRTVTGRLKTLADRLLGPNADVAIINQLLRPRRQGLEPAVPFRVDERVLKPRVAGFIAVGGSLTPQWKTLTLPVLHTLTFSMQIAVVDQVQFEGAGTPRSIVLDEAALARAGDLGRTVADQVGRRFEDAEYRGEPGLCPLCHLDVVVLRGREVACATCGARGTLDADGNVAFDAEGLRHSV